MTRSRKPSPTPPEPFNQSALCRGRLRAPEVTCATALERPSQVPDRKRVRGCRSDEDGSDRSRAGWNGSDKVIRLALLRNLFSDVAIWQARPQAKARGCRGTWRTSRWPSLALIAAAASVARRGFEPLISGLKGRRPSPLDERARRHRLCRKHQLLYRHTTPSVVGGRRGFRTPDLQHVKLALSQLS